MAALRYIDLVLLWLTVPVALAVGAPQLGVLLAAVAWTAQRLVAIAVDRRARQRDNVRDAIALNMATMLGRMWLVGRRRGRRPAERAAVAAGHEHDVNLVVARRRRRRAGGARRVAVRAPRRAVTRR